MVLCSRRVDSCGGFFFQAEDGIRDLVRSRGLGDVYKRQVPHQAPLGDHPVEDELAVGPRRAVDQESQARLRLSLIHI